MESSCLLMFLKPIFSFGIMIFKFFFYVQRTKNNKSKAILFLYAARAKKKKKIHINCKYKDRWASIMGLIIIIFNDSTDCNKLLNRLYCRQLAHIYSRLNGSYYCILW